MDIQGIFALICILVLLSIGMYNTAEVSRLKRKLKLSNWVIECYIKRYGIETLEEITGHKKGERNENA